jgi:type I restriction enzyme, S subunit
MSDSWQTLEIRNLGEVITGRTPPENHPEYFGSDVPFITPTDMDGRRRIEHPVRYLSQLGATALSRTLVPHGVAVSCIGWQMGKSALIEQTSVTNQQINTIVPDEHVVDRLFLYYSLNSRRAEIFQLGAGGSRTPIVNKSTFERLMICLPPLPEQHAIARILGTLDDKIELNRRMNETLEAMARSLFMSWFVDFDPVRAKAEGRQPAGMDADTATLFPDAFEESALGPVPQGWHVRPLDTIARFLNGLALQKYPPRGNEWLPVIKIADLRRGNTEGSDRAGSYLDPEYVVEDGDVLFSWSGTLEVEVWCGGRGALNQHLFKVTSLEFPKWLFFHRIRLHLPDFRATAANKATTIGHIQRYHLTNALVVVPPSTVIEFMNAVMQPLFDRVVCNNLESRTLAAIRDTLLPKLLSGEIRVRDAEQVVEAAI